ncbi:MAG: DNA-formamidopyrimidine glycosylase [Phycisphaeraceae bacterium]|nr:DNA-formamidopyrimidine glycosylase [Phycisphaeraceae bacterium]
MPELPEVQAVRRSLAGHLVGRAVRRVHLRRRDVVRGPRRPADLLAGRRIADLRRHGKQLAIVAEPQEDPERPCVCVHLGMSGSLRILPPGRAAAVDHAHLVWTLEDRQRLVFRDPRRFGGIWTFRDVDEMWTRRWSQMGPDALLMTPADLHARLARTRRCIKAALLDQNLIAGLGNIYVDELLHACGLHPLTVSHRIDRSQARRLVRSMRRLLDRATEAGGSTLRDYVDGTGQPGRFQNGHRVYGRAGERCQACGLSLSRIVVAGRTTVFCRSCQPAHD